MQNLATKRKDNWVTVSPQKQKYTEEQKVKKELKSDIQDKKDKKAVAISKDSKETKESKESKDLTEKISISKAKPSKIGKKDLYLNISKELDSDIKEAENKSTSSDKAISDKSDKISHKASLVRHKTNTSFKNTTKNLLDGSKTSKELKEFKSKEIKELSDNTIPRSKDEIKRKELQSKEKALQETVQTLENTIEEKLQYIKKLENESLELIRGKIEAEKEGEKLHNMEVRVKEAESKLQNIQSREKDVENKLKELDLKSKDVAEKEKSILFRARKIEERTKYLVTREEGTQELEYSLQEKQRFLLAKESGLQGREEFVQIEETNLKKRENDLAVFEKTYEERKNLLAQKENTILEKEKAIKELELSLRLQSSVALSPLNSSQGSTLSPVDKRQSQESALGTASGSPVVELLGTESNVANIVAGISSNPEIAITASSVASGSSLGTLGLSVDRIKFFNTSTYGVINKKGKILITGTGRCGTTFLMILFTLLGLGTGYDPEKYRQSIFAKCNSGLEKHKITKNQRIFKNPKFLKDIGTLSMNLKLIGCVIIPMRGYEEAAESRFKYGLNEPGGLWEATNVEEQIIFYNQIISNYILQMVRWSIPTIFLDFDKMVTSPQYLYTQLLPVLDKVSYDTFEIAYNKASDDQKKNRA